MFVCCECCVLSGRGLCYELITRPEESCVIMCDLENSRMRRPWTALGRNATGKKKSYHNTHLIAPHLSAVSVICMVNGFKLQCICGLQFGVVCVTLDNDRTYRNT